MTSGNSKEGTVDRLLKRSRNEGFRHSILLFVLGLELLPFYMMVQSSVKDNRGFIENPWLPVAPWNLDGYHLGNLVEAVKTVFPMLYNTLFIAIFTVFATLVASVFAAYFFARYKMPGSGILWSIFLFLMIMPGIVNIVPLFAILGNLNLLNTLWALIIVHTAGGQVFNMFILRNFIEEIPKDLFDAAEVDGASHLKQIYHIVIPLAAPIIGTLSILIFISSWNEYLLPLIVLRDPELFPIGVGLIYMDGEPIKEWGKVMAAYFVASVPLIILFSFAMRLFIRGVMGGAIKG